MKITSLTSLFTVAGTVSSILLPAFHVAAQTTVATAPVGYLQTSCLSNSDTLVAPPFTRPAAFTGAVSSISGNVITLGSASLTADAYDAPTTTPATKDTYYLSVGPATATLTGTVSVTSGSATVTGTSTTFGTDVKVGDRITINDGVNLLTYTVTAIASTTSLTIDRAYTDTAATGTTSAVVTASKTTGAKTTTVKTTGRTATVTATAATTSAATLSGLAATYDHSPYEGRFYQVTTNGTGTVTVSLNGDTLYRPWPQERRFRSSRIGRSTAFFRQRMRACLSPPPPIRITVQTEVLIPNFSGVGTNLSALRRRIFSTAAARPLAGGVIVIYRPTTATIRCCLMGISPSATPATAPTLPVTFAGCCADQQAGDNDIN